MTTANGSGKIITFYSYKGGTGRSMALANVAWVLASAGRRVLAVDWDLEAPGLHRYFYPFLIDKELTSSDGIIDFLIDFEYEALEPPEEGEADDKDWYKPHANILRYVAPLNWKFPNGGILDFIPAGRQSASYSSRVTSFNWQNFYDLLGGGVFLEAVKERMREKYDYILIDSRTGVSDSSGICTVQMPDVLVVCFTLNHQSIEGAAAVANSVYEQRRGVEPGIQIFPVPMRIENGEKEKLELRREDAMNNFARFMNVPYKKRAEYWGEVEVLYVPYYAYEEILAPFGDKRGQTVSLLASVERLTAYLTQGDPRGEVTGSVALPDEERQRVLAEYARGVFEAAPDKTEGEKLIDIAENLFKSFTSEQQAIAKRVFERLVRVSPPGELGTTRRQVKRSELGVSAKPILDEMVYQQLVLLGQGETTEEKTVELADEALAEKWKRMQEWLDEDRDFLLWRQGLQLDIAKWESTEGDEAMLLHGADLDKAERYSAKQTEALTDSERAFILESVRVESVRLASAQIKRRLIRAIGTLAIALLLVAGVYQYVFYRERTLVFFGILPQRYVGEWKDNFQITPDGKPDSSLWDYPAQGQWAVVQGEGVTGKDGALLVKGSQMGVLNIKPPVLTDFTAELKVRIVQGTEAAWVFRAQPDKQRGYVFVVTRNLDTKSLKLNGYIYYGNNQYEPLDKDNKDGHVIPFRNCCLPDDAVRIRAEVKGNEFKFWVTVENIKIDEKKDGTIELKTADRSVLGSKYSDTGIEFFIEPFKDNRSVFPYGNVGLFERDDNSQMKVEFMRISSSAGK